MAVLFVFLSVLCSLVSCLDKVLVTCLCWSMSLPLNSVHKKLYGDTASSSLLFRTRIHEAFQANTNCSRNDDKITSSSGCVKEGSIIDLTLLSEVSSCITGSDNGNNLINLSVSDHVHETSNDNSSAISLLNDSFLSNRPLRTNIACILTHPLLRTKDVEISHSDINTLHGTMWLNSSIISAFFSLLQFTFFGEVIFLKPGFFEFMTIEDEDCYHFHPELNRSWWQSFVPHGKNPISCDG